MFYALNVAGPRPFGVPTACLSGVGPQEKGRRLSPALARVRKHLAAAELLDSRKARDVKPAQLDAPLLKAVELVRRRRRPSCHAAGPPSSLATQGAWVQSSRVR